MPAHTLPVINPAHCARPGDTSATILARYPGKPSPALRRLALRRKQAAILAAAQQAASDTFAESDTSRQR